MPRKSKETKKNYFDETEEWAVQEYLKSDDLIYREKIFNEFLSEPLTTMIESLIKRYRLMRDDISIEDLKNDTLSFLLTKFDKFEPAQNKKAYSYYGTVSVNYLKTELLKYSKQKNRNISYEDISSDLEEDERYTYEIEIEDKVEVIDFIPMISSRIKEEIEKNKKLKPNEIKVGKTIYALLDNWETMIKQTDKGNILARNKILYEIRESTFLTSKEVRIALKKFKSIYEILKKTIYLD